MMPANTILLLVPSSQHGRAVNRERCLTTPRDGAPVGNPAIRPGFPHAPACPISWSPSFAA